MWLQNSQIQWKWQEGQIWLGLYPRKVLPLLVGSFANRVEPWMWTWQKHSWKAIPCQPGYEGMFFTSSTEGARHGENPERKEFFCPTGDTESHPFLELLDRSLTFHFRMIIPLT